MTNCRIEGGLTLTNTLCWGCQNACGGCSWSDYDERKPVDGWTAERVQIKLNGVWGTTYNVITCPEFIPDEKKEHKPKRKGRKKP